MDNSRIKDTIQYYQNNAQSFAAGTVNVEFHETQDRFLSKLKGGSLILDFGCGSGRDSKYFLDKGYFVEATDGSPEMVKLASAYIGQPVKQLLFTDLHEVSRYDGIWACASILHLAKPTLQTVLHQINQALKPGGILYTSFKYGNWEGMRNGRYFTDFDEESFREFLDKEEWELEEEWITGDVRVGREKEKWLNVILNKR